MEEKRRPEEVGVGAKVRKCNGMRAEERRGKVRRQQRVLTLSSGELTGKRPQLGLGSRASLLKLKLPSHDRKLAFRSPQVMAQSPVEAKCSAGMICHRKVGKEAFLSFQATTAAVVFSLVAL